MQILQISTHINQGSVNFISWLQTYLQITWAPECRALVDFVLPEDCCFQNNKQRPPPKKKTKQNKTKEKTPQQQKKPKKRTKQNKTKNKTENKQNKTKPKPKPKPKHTSFIYPHFYAVSTILCHGYVQGNAFIHHYTAPIGAELLT